MLSPLEGGCHWVSLQALAVIPYDYDICTCINTANGAGTCPLIFPFAYSKCSMTGISNHTELRPTTNPNYLRSGSAVSMPSPCLPETHSSIARALLKIQDMVSTEDIESKRLRTGFLDRISAAFGMGGGTPEEVYDSVQSSRRAAMEYLIQTGEVLQYTEGEIQQLQELLAFLENSPVDYTESVRTITQFFMSIHGHIMSFNIPVGSVELPK